MKKKVLTLILLVLLLFSNSNNVFSQTNRCREVNTIPDFTNLYDPSVTCYYGIFSNPFENTGIINGRHTLITSQGKDYNTNNQLPYLPPGENKVIRLGNDNTGSEAEAITYKFTVDYFKSILLLKFAVVFEDPGHPSYEQPRFTVRVTNLNGELVESCAEYDVTAAGNIPGFNSYQGIRWRPWTNVGIDLSSYIGEEIIVEFITKDCDQSGHFGYAYFTASCISNNLDIVNCDGTNITLKGPDNFNTYKWSNGNISQQTQFTVTDTSLDTWCDITSVTGCTFRLNAHITKESGLPTQDTIIYDSLCFGHSYEMNFFNLPIQNTKGDFIYLNTLCNLNDCNYTTITLLLNVSDKVPDVIISDTICLGEIYNKNGFKLVDLPIGNFTYQNNHTTDDGCDSTTYLHLNVIETYKDIKIDGAENVLISSDLTTGYYKYTCTMFENFNDYKWTIENPEWEITPNGNECIVHITTLIDNKLIVSAENYCDIHYDTLYLKATSTLTDKLKSDHHTIFPNPTKNNITVHYNNIVNIQILNTYGQVIYDNNYNHENNVSIDLSILENSTYIVKIITNKEIYTQRITLIK